MQIDVFTLLPHAFAWLTEQRPVAAVLGSGLDLRFLNYRDYTPLTGGQVDDEPYGGAQEWCCGGRRLRALEAVYGDSGGRRVIAFAAGTAARPGRRRACREEALTLLRPVRGVRRAHPRAVATDTVSVGPYVLSGGELPAMVVLDAVARRLPGAIREESAAVESFSAAREGGLEFPHYTRPAEFRGWRVPDVLLSGNHALIESWRRAGSTRGRRRAGRSTA
jgi:tRNA (guanine37-N1)-methyltransferase